MIIRDFEPKYTEEAAEIALAAYNLERAFTQELPEISDIPILKHLSGNDFGVARTVADNRGLPYPEKAEACAMSYMTGTINKEM